ncbi:hypothetical protein DVS28_a5027 [Euzebya pacifica]|uniref:Nucleotidyltransferase family protein n=1 Tax=Euzebya pacifica TaxID=1608957 RepID=A0A346Y5D7_9ACTN|nr:hypothetical protein [Euzebya pacifica]AXV09684.1 hypothetical protein DVS28_a5027 [Euzebya pacifica]
MGGPMKLDRDFAEFIACCLARDVRFLIVGGYAVAVHGHPRYTKDLDVWVWIGDDNPERLLLALADFGFGGVGLVPSDFRQPERVVQLGQPPKRIDLLTSVDGVEFDDCYADRLNVVIEGLPGPVPFIDLHWLRVNKQASGRAQDLADLEALADES